MKRLTCPNCQQKYSARLYYRTALKLRQNEFNCHYCGSRLSFIPGRRFVLLLISFTPIVAGPFVIAYLSTQFGLAPGLAFLVYMAFFVAWAAFMLQFEQFKKVS